ncbi:putative endophilin B1 [Schistosoma mansoni]|uniref:putative endophilin B1 n=1 Tax=Schistosoma mansoni TaxID=6183 RepID=UPI0001A620F3|nr:putative endophilin B1 [Schistosoma mansoni]|eukprot:XP_018655686.1 putative endophilin B1 [Schistosoma mansoni]
MKKFLDNTNTKLNRALQKTNEVIGRAEKTEFDEEFVSLLRQAESTHEASKQIMEAIEQWINPCVLKKFDDVACKVESMVTDNKSYWLKVPAKLPAEHLGDTLLSIAVGVGAGTAYVPPVDISDGTGIVDLNPQHGSWDICKELGHLESYRLDYDKFRSKVKHNEYPDPETLKKMEDAKTVLYKQLDKTRSRLQQVKSVNDSNMMALKELVAAQRTYFTECKQRTEELSAQMERLK